MAGAEGLLVFFEEVLEVSTKSARGWRRCSLPAVVGFDEQFRLFAIARCQPHADCPAAVAVGQRADRGSWATSPRIRGRGFGR